MATIFLDDGSDGTADLSNWTGSTGTTASATDQAHTGPRSIKQSLGNPAVATSMFSSGLLADAGRRISFWFRFDSLPSGARSTVFMIQKNDNVNNVFILRLGGTGTPGQLRAVATGVTAVDGTAVLAANTWYRISVSYSITNSTTFSFKTYVNGVLDSTVNSGTLTHVSSANLYLQADVSFGVDRNVWFDSVYIDDVADGTDPGDIRVTAKRPLSNGTLNEWTTQIGAGNSGYGTGHADEVNERPLDTADGWSIQNVAKKTEQFTVEGASVGDVNLTGTLIKDWMAWVYAKAATAQTGNIIVGGTASNILLTTSYARFRAAKGSTAYPAGNTDVGIDTNTVNELFSLAECGVLIAYTPNPFKAAFARGCNALLRRRI